MNVHLFTEYSSTAVLDQIDIQTKGKTKTKEKAQVTFLTGGQPTAHQYHRITRSHFGYVYLMHRSQTQHKQPNSPGLITPSQDIKTKRHIYILSQAIQGFVELSCKVQVVQHLLVLFHSRLKWKSKAQITSAGSRDTAHLRRHY